MPGNQHKQGGGPRSERGKRSSSQNARQHGLAVPIARIPALAPEVDRLARVLARSPDPRRLELARRLAEAHIDCQRVRETRFLTLRLMGAMGAEPVLDLNTAMVYANRYRSKGSPTR